MKIINSKKGLVIDGEWNTIIFSNKAKEVLIPFIEVDENIKGITVTHFMSYSDETGELLESVKNFIKNKIMSEEIKK